MSESDFNRGLRGVLRSKGLKVLHIVEADHPGPSDLVVWEPTAAKICAWLELKENDEALRPSQVEFMRDRDQEAGNAYVVRHYAGTGIISVERPRKVDGWSTDNGSLIVQHQTADLTGFDWVQCWARWKRSRK